jgi:hypothetical protein
MTAELPKHSGRTSEGIGLTADESEGLRLLSAIPATKLPDGVGTQLNWCLAILLRQPRSVPGVLRGLAAPATNR